MREFDQIHIQLHTPSKLLSRIISTINEISLTDKQHAMYIAHDGKPIEEILKVILDQKMSPYDTAVQIINLISIKLANCQVDHPNLIMVDGARGDDATSRQFIKSLYSMKHLSRLIATPTPTISAIGFDLMMLENYIVEKSEEINHYLNEAHPLDNSQLEL